MGRFDHFPGHEPRGIFGEERSCGFFLGGCVEGVACARRVPPRCVPALGLFVEGRGLGLKKGVASISSSSLLLELSGAGAGAGGRRRTGAWLRARGGGLRRGSW